MKLEELEEAYQIAARIVVDFGDVYLPIFERIKTEIDNYNKNEAMKKLALEAVKR